MRRILYYMSLFVHAVPATVPKNSKVKYASLILAGFFVVIAVAQLYSFEEFPDAIASLWLPGGRAFANLVAALLVSGEVLALPFLLFMRLSPAMRIVSMAAGWCVLIGWVVMSLWVNMTVNSVMNAGVLGATIPTTPGWWVFALFIAMVILMAYISWNTFNWLPRTSKKSEL
jgi:hypothetical protein